MKGKQLILEEARSLLHGNNKIRKGETKNEEMCKL